MLIADVAPHDIEAAISVVSITELHFGTLLCTDDDERARRTDRLAVVEATFDPLPVTVEVARAWGRLAAAVAQRGGKPRRRQLDLAIAATATIAKVPLLTSESSTILSMLSFPDSVGLGARSPLVDIMFLIGGPWGSARADREATRSAWRAAPAGASRATS